MKRLHTTYLIIGGGPAGSTAASYLAKEGASVILTEKESFPREHVGESLLPFCYDIFTEIGVLKKLESSFVRKPGVRFNDLHGEQYSTSCFSEHIEGPAHLSFHVYRAQFDKILLDHAASLGAEVHESTRITNINWSPENVVAMCQGTSGSFEIEAKFVIDASGQSAVVAKSKNMRKAIPGFERIAFSAHWVGAKKIHGIEEGLLNIFHLGNPDKQGWVWCIPISKEKVSVGVVLDNQYIKAQKATLNTGTEIAESIYRNEIATSKKLSEILANAQLAGPVAVNNNYSYYSETGLGQQYALIGDAYKFIDPIFATGVLMSMKSAQQVSKALLTGKHEALQSAFNRVEGAYQLVEQMIRSYYNKETIDFYEFEGLKETDFGKKESAFKVVHGLLAGDLFDRSDIYLEFFSGLKKQETLERYYNLVHKGKRHAPSCVSASAKASVS